MSEWVELCHIDDISNPGSRGFDPTVNGTDSLFIVREKDSVFAYKDVCPHYGVTTLPWKKDQYLNSQKSAIVCSSHGAKFNIQSGLCTAGPCKGETLESLPTKVKDGYIFVKLSS
jgi:nitrite reductase/ring-hydroxylating ferredoxin subunit